MPTKKLTHISTILIFLFFASSCKKNQQDNTPYIPVDVYVNMDLPQYQPLSIPGGWVYAQGGLRGLIIYRRSFDEFVAFDRNCTYNEANSCGVTSVESSNVLISCPCDGSVYNIYDGTVNQGPAALPLNRYNASFDGNNTIHVFN